MVVRAEALEGGAVEGLAGVGVRNADDQLGALLEALAVEIDGTVLRDQPMDMVTGRHDTGAFRQDRSDLADTLVGSRRHGDDGLAAFGERSAVGEVDLAADTTIELRTEGVGADLAGDVHLEGGVDGADLRVLGDDVRVVGIADIHHGHHRVVIDEVIDLLRTHQERGDHLALVDLLVHTVDDAFLDERQHAVGEHLGVDTEVLVVTQLGEHGVRDGTDTHLQAGAVFHEVGAVDTDLGLDLGRLGEVGRHQRRIVFHEEVDHAGRDDGVTPGAWDVFVDHGDHRLCTFDSSQGRIDRSTQGDIPVFVDGRHLDHRHVAGQDTAAVELLRLAQEDGNVVGPAGLDILADIAAHEEGLVEERAIEAFLGVGRFPFGVEVMDADILEFAGLATTAEGLNEYLRGAGHAAQMNVVTALDDLDGLVGGDEFDILHIENG